MKLTAKTDLGIPAAAVYASLTDHAHWEREAVRRGVEVERPANLPLAGVGAGWAIRAPFRGKRRRFLVQVEGMTPDERAEYSIKGQAVHGVVAVEVIALSARRSRLRIVVDVHPITLAARLFINTLRLAKGRVQARLDKRVAALGAYLQDRHARSQMRA